MIRYLMLLAGVTLIVATASAQVRVTGGKQQSLEELKGTQTYVTIVLKNGSVAFNERIRTIADTYLGTEDENGQPQAYPLNEVSEVRVQLGRVKRPVLTGGTRAGARTVEDRSIGDRASSRAFEVFENNRDKGHLLLQAASIIAAAEGPRAADAMGFLTQRAGSADIPTAVEASLYLYLAGGEVDPSIVEQGLLSGVRQTIAGAARVAGLVNASQFSGDIRALMSTPAPEVFAPAAVSAAMLGERSIIPDLIDAMRGINDQKAVAAVHALILLGGEDVQAAMLNVVAKEKGNGRFRAMRVLYEIGYTEVVNLIRPEELADPVLKVESAILLAQDRDWDAILYLRGYLDQPRDPNLENLVMKARVAAALFEGGHPPARSVLQDLLRMTPDGVYVRGNDQRYREETMRTVKITVCRLAGQIANRQLLTVVQSALEAEDPEVALSACEAVVAITAPEFAERVYRSRL